MNIFDEDKTTHSVGCTHHSELFEDEWTHKWEAMIDRDWTVVCNIWVKKYKEVTCATMMASKRWGYESSAALRAWRSPPPRAPTVAYFRIQRPCRIYRGAQG